METDTQYMEISERLKTHHLSTSSAVDSLAGTSALLEKARELRAAGLDYGGGQMHRIIGEVRPDYVIIENSPLLGKRGFEYVLHGLSETGGRTYSGPNDVVFKDCKMYSYVSIDSSIY